jgi:hypothetical protein
MKPIDQARAIYEREPCSRTFDEDMALHLAHGFVFSTPSFFIMGRPVPRGAYEDQIVDPAVVFAPELCDCWHVHVLAGDASRAWSILPWPLEWLSYQRNNELRFFPMADMQRILQRSK